jgi:hypothetical protein
VTDDLTTDAATDIVLPDVHEAATGEIPHTVVHFNAMVGAAFRAANDKRARSQQRALGMSELGGCRRQAGFKVTNTPQSNPQGDRTDIFADSREAMIGSMIHDTILPQIAEMSMTAEIEKPVVLKFEGLPEVPGSVDMVDGDIVLDLKCLSPETPILMADGRAKRADEIKVDDLVVVYDQIHDKLVHGTIAAVEENGDQPTVEVITESGRRLKVTDEHPVWVKDDPESLGRWVDAFDLEAGMLATLALSAPVETPQPLPEIGPDDPWLLGLLAAVQFTPDDLMVKVSDETVRAVAMTSIALMEPGYANELWRRNSWIGLGDPQIPDDVILSGPRAWQEWLSGFSAMALSFEERTSWKTPNRAFAEQMAAMLCGLGIKAHIGMDDYGKPVVSVRDDYGVKRLSSALWLRGNKSERLRAIAERLDGTRPEHYELDRITAVIRDSEPTRTLAIEVAEFHTFVTGGLVTHNTVGSNSATYYQTHGASRRHLFQTHGYAQALINAGHDIRHVALAYIDRSNGQVVHMHYQPFDPGIVMDIEQWWLEVNSATDPMDLPRDEKGPGISRQCDWCPWLNLCWGPDAKPGEIGPQKVIVHEASDENAEVERWLREYHAASKAEKEATENKKMARAVLADAPAGQYGSFVLGWSPDGSYETLDADAAEKALTAAGLPVPKVTRTRQGAIRVKPSKKV